jgi:catechol 2,3-dioxygenase-like lactoylglutathione lyase family enzyme
MNQSPAPVDSGTTATGVRYVHHISFRVDDLDASLDFYERVLGCTRIDRPAISVPGAWLALDQLQIHLIEWHREPHLGTPPDAATPYANHIAFSVADYPGFRSHLIANGMHPVDGPDPTVTQMVVQDPSGNVIEFTPYTR